MMVSCLARIDEAVAGGVPCVTTNAGEAAVLVGDTGFVSPPRDVARVAEQIVNRFRLPWAEQQALGVQARQRIEQESLLGNIVRKYDELYASVRRSAT